MKRRTYKELEELLEQNERLLSSQLQRNTALSSRAEFLQISLEKTAVAISSVVESIARVNNEIRQRYPK
jgi:hypothetical protein